MGGSNPTKGGSFSTYYLIFHKFPHETEIIWSPRGIQANHLNPSKSATVLVYRQTGQRNVTNDDCSNNRYGFLDQLAKPHYVTLHDILTSIHFCLEMYQ